MTFIIAIAIGMYAATTTIATTATVPATIAAETAEEAAAKLRQTYEAIDRIADPAEQHAANEKFKAQCQQFINDWSGKVSSGPAFAILGLAHTVTGDLGKSRTMLEAFQKELVGKPAPPLPAINLIGGEGDGGASAWSLEKLKGKVVLIDFWATWCAPCRAALPHLKEIAAKYAQDGLVVVGATQLYRNGFLNGEIKQGLDEEAELKLINDFKAEFRINYLLVVCVKGSSMFNYGVLSIPTVVLVDRAGNVRSIDVNPPAEALDKRLSSLLAEKAGS